MIKEKSSYASSITYFLMVILFVTLRMLANYGVLDFLAQNEVVADVVLSCFIQIGIMFSMSLFAYSLIKKQKVKTTFKQFGFKKISFKAVLICILMGFCIFFINILVSSFFNGIISGLGYESSNPQVESYPLWQLFVNLIITALLPAICEETAHRGMLLSSYKTQGLKTTILLSGLMFGLMHMNIEQFFYATLIGFFFGYITCKTSSIYPAMIFHFMNNGLSCLFSFASVNEIKWLDFFGFMTNMASTNTFLYLIFFLTLVAICVFVVQMLIPQLMKNTNFKTAENIGKQLAKYKLRAEYFEGLKNLAGEDSKLNKDIDEMLEETSLELEYELYNVSREQMFEYQIKKTKNFDKPTKILVIATICLQAVVTLFTFIWGIF